MTVKKFAWNPYRFHCYGIPATQDGEAEIFVADLFPAWMVPGLILHEIVELRTGSHRLAVVSEILAYHLVWPIYHLVYLWIVHRYPLSNKLF